jgi:hypothetical protein
LDHRHVFKVGLIIPTRTAVEYQDRYSVLTKGPAKWTRSLRE